MAQNPDAPPQRAQSILQAANRHSESVALVLGLILGSTITLLGVLVGG